VFFRRDVDHGQSRRNPSGWSGSQAQLRGNSAARFAQRLAQGAGWRPAPASGSSSESKRSGGEQVGLARRHVDRRFQALRPVGHVDLGQAAPRRIAGYPAAVEQLASAAGFVDEQAVHVVAVAPVANLVVEKEGESKVRSNHLLRRGGRRALRSSRRAVARDARALRRAPPAAGNQGLFLGALQLPEAQGDECGKQQRGQQRRAPLEIKCQRASRTARGGGIGRASLYCAIRRQRPSRAQILIVCSWLLVISLVSGAYFLMIDQGDKNPAP
jgi:hypothetical protein